MIAAPATGWRPTPGAPERGAGGAVHLREPGSGTRAVQERALARLKLPARVVMALGSTEAIKRVVAEGVGLAIVSRLSVPRNVPRPPWPCCRSPGCASRGRLHLVPRKGRRDGPALQAFCGVLREMTAAQFG